MEKSAKIYVAGHRGLVGAALLRALEAQGFANLLTRSRAELDLTDQAAVADFFRAEKPDYVFLAAAKVGGIGANNTYPADFIRDNLLIQTNIIENAHKSGCKKLLFLGSSCIYPKLAEQPMKETALLSGALEPTNSAYALAKLAGIEMCQAYRRQHGFNAICVMPPNLYGIGDNFDIENAHVLPALIRRFQEAKEAATPVVSVWGTGTPLREFMFVDDLADACLFLMENYSEEALINAGTGEEVSIRRLAETIAEVVGYTGKITFDPTKPDGTPRKIMDSSRLKALGWAPQTTLAEGLRLTHAWFMENREGFRGQGNNRPQAAA